MLMRFLLTKQSELKQLTLVWLCSSLRLSSQCNVCKVSPIFLTVLSTHLPVRVFYTHVVKTAPPPPTKTFIIIIIIIIHYVRHNE